MKAKFKKDVRHPLIWIPVVAFFTLLIVHVTLVNPELWSLLVFGGIIFQQVINLLPYRLMDNDILLGNGMINVHSVGRLEEKNRRIIAYYINTMNGIERSRSFFVKDRKSFIDALLKINPAIKLN